MKKVFLKLFKNKNSQKQNAQVRQRASIESTSEHIFNKYEETFRDLARYDRGDEILTKSR